MYTNNTHITILHIILYNIEQLRNIKQLNITINIANSITINQRECTLSPLFDLDSRKKIISQCKVIELYGS